jgi:anti-sigma factor RsiW
MNCIKDFDIQKFIDGEATKSEVFIVENHIKACEKCALKVNNQRKLAASIKKGINLLEKDSIEIPGILIPSKAIKNNSSSNRRLIYLIAAASILLFLFVVQPKNETSSQQDNSVELGYSMEVDANRPVSKLPMVISIIDSKGNVTEYFMTQ